jgi:hypothetical protein
MVLVHLLLSRNANSLTRRFEALPYQAQIHGPDKRRRRPLFTQSWDWTLVQAI